jgi:hypothetical protein
MTIDRHTRVFRLPVQRDGMFCEPQRRAPCLRLRRRVKQLSAGFFNIFIIYKSYQFAISLMLAFS